MSTVPKDYQYKVLFWGIIGALAMRVVFVLAGIRLIERFEWVIYVFGAFLILTGAKMLKKKELGVNPEHNPVLRLFRSIFSVSKTFEEGHFFVRRNQKWLATPLFIVLLVVESTDLVFAVDSIPAILAITRDPFIVYTSNVFAILGLRALYFALSDMIGRFEHLHYGLGALLTFVGGKMLLSDVVHLPPWVTLVAIVVILGLSIVFSLRKTRNLRNRAA